MFGSMRLPYGPTLAAATLLAFAACGGQATSHAPPPTGSTPSTTEASSPPAAASPAPQPAANLPDFPVVAYQGEATFAGRQGHFAAAFASGHPVVLLFFAGL